MENTYKKIWETPRLLSTYVYPHGDYRVLLDMMDYKNYWEAEQEAIRNNVKGIKNESNDRNNNFLELPTFIKGLAILRKAQITDRTVSYCWSVMKETNYRSHLSAMFSFNNTPEGFNFWKVWNSRKGTLINQFLIEQEMKENDNWKI